MEYFAYSQTAFVYKYVVMLSDTDQFQHMSFANYLKLMFLASDALLVSCLDQNFLSKIRLREIDSRMQFKKQTSAGDNILIKVNSSEIAGSHFSALYTFLIEGSAELVALGRQTFSLLDISTQKPAEMPEKMKVLLTPISVDERHLLYKY